MCVCACAGRVNLLEVFHVLLVRAWYLFVLCGFDVCCGWVRLSFVCGMRVIVFWFCFVFTGRVCVCGCVCVCVRGCACV